MKKPVASCTTKAPILLAAKTISVAKNVAALAAMMLLFRRLHRYGAVSYNRQTYRKLTSLTLCG